MDTKQREQHRKSSNLLVYFTAKELCCDKREVFRLAHSLACSKDLEADWQKYCEGKQVSETVYDFCLDILAHRIVPVMPIKPKKTKKRRT